MILVITDGAPHDFDVFHPEILVQDAARAITTAFTLAVFATERLKIR